MEKSKTSCLKRQEVSLSKNLETSSQTLLPFLKERKRKNFSRKLRFLKNIDFIRKNVSFSNKVFCPTFFKKVGRVLNVQWDVRLEPTGVKRRLGNTQGFNFIDKLNLEDFFFKVLIFLIIYQYLLFHLPDK